MAFSDDFIPGMEDDGKKSADPEIFGLKLTPKIQGILLGIAGLGIAIGIWIYLVQPVAEQKAQLQTQFDENVIKVQSGGALKKKLQEAESDLDNSKQQQQAIKIIFGDEKLIQTLYLDFDRLVRLNKAKLLDITPILPSVSQPNQPKPPTAGQGVDTISFDVKLQGTFDQTQSILRSLERLPSLIVIKNLKTDLVQLQDSQKFVVGPRGNILTVGESILVTSFRLEVLLLAKTEVPPTADPKAPPTGTTPPKTP